MGSVVERLTVSKNGGTAEEYDFLDTKNTAGSSNTANKLYIVGAKTQDLYAQTFSNQNAYVGTDGCLYSGGAKVLTSHQDISGKVDKVSGKGLSTNDYTTDEKNKLSGIAAGAEVNQNAFSNVTVGSTTVSADSKTDTLTLVAGSNVTITPDATNDKITIAATDTTYSAATTSAAGLMSADDKTKLNGIAAGATANVGTITGIKMNGASKGTSGVVDLGTVITAHQDISGKMNISLKGAAGGVAELDSSGKVPSSQLPSYVDDVLEYNNASDFPTTGEAGKIYVNKATNQTYRWGGSSYVEISPSLALGETSATAYRGDRGKTAYDHASAKGSAFVSGFYKVTTNSQGHVTAATAVTKSDITGLGIPGSDTNTHRPIQVNGTQILGDNTTALNLKAGSNVSVTNSSGTVTIAATDTTYSAATTSEAGLMSADDKTKLNGIAAGAEVNQNAFSNVTVGSTTVSADSKTDTLTLVAGSNVTITPDATNDKITIAATDTTYTSKAAASGGTEVSLVTTGEKATWNAKTSNVGTITGIKMNGASKGTSGVVDLGTVITAHQDISGKVDKVSGKGLSTNDYTTDEKNKLSGIETGATANIGTITGITMNGTSKGTSGVVDIGTVITALGESSSTAYRGDRGAAAYAAAVTNVETSPSASSSNLITSGGVYSYVEDVASRPFFANIGFSIGVNDWVGSSAPYTYTLTDSRIGSNTTIDVYPDYAGCGDAFASISWKRTQNGSGPDFYWTPVSGGVQFYVTAKPTGIISGNIRVLGNASDHRMVMVSDDTIPLTKGGTGATNAAGARVNLGLGAVENKSSATIRSELTSADVTAALGYTPLETHQTVSASNPTLSWNTQSTIGTIGGTALKVTLPENPNTDTKNTAGSTDTGSKIFLIGATSQSDNPQTYSHDTVYVGTDGLLYSNNKPVINCGCTWGDLAGN